MTKLKSKRELKNINIASKSFAIAHMAVNKFIIVRLT